MDKSNGTYLDVINNNNEIENSNNEINTNGLSIISHCQYSLFIIIGHISCVSWYNGTSMILNNQSVCTNNNIYNPSSVDNNIHKMYLNQ